MDEQPFELMYRVPDADNHVPLPVALDYFFWRITNLEQRNEELENRVIALEEKLTDHTIQAHH
jgi:hypothetical protein